MDFSEFTKDQLQRAMLYAAEINWKCTSECMDDDFGFADHVTDQDKLNYREKQETYAEEIEAGKHDHNFTIRQRMYYFLTGESVALLP